MTLTVVVVTWNRLKELLRLLADLATQSAPADEIVVVDNGSDDGTAEAVASRFPTIRVVRLQENMGLSVGRNVGIANANSDLLAILDNDLRVLDPAFLSKVRESAATHADCGIISFHCSNGLWPEDRRQPGARLLSMQDLRTLAQRRESPVTPRAFYDWFFWGGACVLRRSVITLVGLFDGEFAYGGEEWDFAMRCHAAGVRLLRDEGLWVIHLRSRQMRAPWSNALIFENMVIALSRYLPNRALVLFLPAQLAASGLKALRTGGIGTFAKSVGRLLKTWRRRVLAKRMPVSKQVAARFFYLRTHRPIDYSEVERARTTLSDYYRSRWNGTGDLGKEQLVFVDCTSDAAAE